MAYFWGHLPYRTKIAWGMALTFLLYLGVTFMVTQSVNDYMHSRARLTEITRIQSQRDALFSTLQDAETGQRGFIITGDERYLAPYQEAVKNLPVIVNQLQQSLAGDPFQASHMKEVEQLTTVKLTELQKSIEARRRSGIHAAAAIVQTGNGMHTMEKIRQIMSEMQQEYSVQQQTQAALTDRSTRYMLDVLSVSQIIAFGLLLMLYSVIYREARQRAQAERLLQETNDNLEQMVAKRTEELKQSNQELEQFAFVASHDLQAPLRKVQLFIEMLREELSRQELTEQARDYMGRVEKSASRMQELIVDLLAISRVNRRGAPFQLVDLQAVASEAVDELNEVIQKNEGCIEVGPMCQLEADPEQMRQLLINLVSNAIKYHQEGVPPAVKISSTLKEQDVCELVVADNGIGIPKDYQDKVFEIFQRLHGSKYEGNGIGLSIVKRIVERHGGKVKIDSQMGRGSQFIVQLPAHHASA